MRDLLAILAAVALALAAIVGLSFGGVWLYSAIAPRQEAARTEVYRNTKSYTEGTIRDMRRMRVEYERAGDGHRDALRSLILHRAGELDWSALPADTRRFLEELEEGR